MVLLIMLIFLFFLLSKLVKQMFCLLDHFEDIDIDSSTESNIFLHLSKQSENMKSSYFLKHFFWIVISKNLFSEQQLKI